MKRAMIGDRVLVYTTYPRSKQEPDFQGTVIAVTDTHVQVKSEGWFYPSCDWFSREDIEVIRHSEHGV